jgi:glucose-1-phosphate cytidylyltransferase
MKVVILCGGYGTRIRDVADDIPKPMIPIGGKPILWHIMKYYYQYKQNDFILCLGYKGYIIKDFFLNYEAHTKDLTISTGLNPFVHYHSGQECDNWTITLAETGSDAMTGARIKRVKKYLQGEENFLLTYGDGVGDVDLDALMEFHKSHGKILTVTGVRPPGRFGEMLISANGQVQAFNEKPQASGGRINGGYFVCKQKIFDYLDDRENLIFEQDPINRLVKDGQMMVYEHNGFWQPMDTSREYKLLNDYVERGDAPWVVW